MRHALKPFPDWPQPAAMAVEVDVARSRPAHLTLRYVVTGTIADLRIAPVTAPDRTDELWRTTCFEAFVRAPGSERYVEFNFGPSTQWAAYGFDACRAWVRNTKLARAPLIEVSAVDTHFELRAALDLQSVTDLPGGEPWTLALSAVIEEKSGAKSFWALKHPPDKPDFHHADCFALTVPPP